MCFSSRIISSGKTRRLRSAALALLVLAGTASAGSNVAGPTPEMFDVLPMTALEQAMRDSAVSGFSSLKFEIYTAAPFDGFEPFDVPVTLPIEPVPGNFNDGKHVNPIGRSAIAIPEPATWALLLLGSWGLLRRKRVRR